MFGINIIKNKRYPDTLSYEKNLDVIIGDVLPGVITTLVFKVIEPANRNFCYA